MLSPISITFFYGLVMVSLEMSTTPTFRMYRNSRRQAALEAACSGNEWSIPLFHADFPGFTGKGVEHSLYLLIMELGPF